MPPHSPCDNRQYFEQCKGFRSNTAGTIPRTRSRVHYQLSDKDKEAVLSTVDSIINSGQGAVFLRPVTRFCCMILCNLGLEGVLMVCITCTTVHAPCMNAMQ